MPIAGKFCKDLWQNSLGSTCPAGQSDGGLLVQARTRNVSAKMAGQARCYQARYAGTGGFDWRPIIGLLSLIGDVAPSLPVELVSRVEAGPGHREQAVIDIVGYVLVFLDGHFEGSFAKVDGDISLGIVW